MLNVGSRATFCQWPTNISPDHHQVPTNVPIPQNYFLKTKKLKTRPSDFRQVFLGSHTYCIHDQHNSTHIQHSRPHVKIFGKMTKITLVNMLHAIV
jgi:hypothetical protein